MLRVSGKGHYSVQRSDFEARAAAAQSINDIDRDPAQVLHDRVQGGLAALRQIRLQVLGAPDAQAALLALNSDFRSQLETKTQRYFRGYFTNSSGDEALRLRRDMQHHIGSLLVLQDLRKLPGGTADSDNFRQKLDLLKRVCNDNRGAAGRQAFFHDARDPEDFAYDLARQSREWKFKSYRGVELPALTHVESRPVVRIPEASFEELLAARRAQRARDAAPLETLTRPEQAQVLEGLAILAKPGGSYHKVDRHLSRPHAALTHVLNEQWNLSQRYPSHIAVDACRIVSRMLKPDDTTLPIQIPQETAAAVLDICTKLPPLP